MGKLKGRRPSPALLVAVVALVAALGGGAVAGVAVTSLNKKDKKQVRKIAKKLDKKAIKSIPAGPKGNPGRDGSDGASAFIGQFNNLGSGTRFGFPVGEGSISDTEAAVVGLSPNATIVARDLSVKLSDAPGAGNSRTFTLRDDGADTGVSCVISDAAPRCDSGAATATIGPSSEVTIKMTATGLADPVDTVSFGWRGTTP